MLFTTNFSEQLGAVASMFRHSLTSLLFPYLCEREVQKLISYGIP